MKNKRIAVVFAGQARTFRYCYKTHLDFFKKEGYEFDFFIHTWSDQWFSSKINSNLNISNPINMNGERLKEELQEIYQPKSIVVEKQKECEELIEDIKALIRLQKSCDCRNEKGDYQWDNLNLEKSIEHWLQSSHVGQIYSWQKAANLKIQYQKQNNIKYDSAIKFRLDNFMDTHNDNKKQRILDDIGNYKVGFYTNRERPDSDRRTMKFQWQNKPPRDYWNVSDMMFGGPSDIFDILMIDIYKFWLRRYTQVIGDSSGKWTHQGSSEGILGRKLAHDEIATGGFGAGHFPYRDYHINHPEQTYKSLHKLRQSTENNFLKKYDLKLYGEL
tara:strand:+ start:2830 stop:3819 length:990 start_codon:yes stop_codon:yes gene_type:complete